jgi:hypothetical protein
MSTSTSTIRTKTISGSSKTLETEDWGVNMPLGARTAHLQLNEEGYKSDGPIPYEVEVEVLTANNPYGLSAGTKMRFTPQNTSVFRLGIMVGTPPSGSP